MLKTPWGAGRKHNDKEGDMEEHSHTTTLHASGIEGGVPNGGLPGSAELKAGTSHTSPGLGAEHIEQKSLIFLPLQTCKGWIAQYVPLLPLLDCPPSPPPVLLGTSNS